MRKLWLTIFFVTLVWSGISPKDYLTWVLEVFPALIGLVVMAVTWRKFPLTRLIVLGGIYTGWLTPVEAGAAGALAALLIAVLRRRITWQGLWETAIETGHITASILFLITMASLYSRMLGYAGLPNELNQALQTYQLGFVEVMIIYVVLMLFLGTLLDTASIILIVVPLLPALHPPLVQTLVLMPGASPAARGLADRLTSPIGRAALARAGFGLP